MSCLANPGEPWSVDCGVLPGAGAAARAGAETRGDSRPLPLHTGQGHELRT